ncbi:hypothetical protein LCGC14_2599900 [marine sediment metagenome]|uniref:Uncharacterized protein n=1 Tax=marine sediment metagenome TaxID=412755 RepID=A0A0F9AWS0_9ZZZZ
MDTCVTESASMASLLLWAEVLSVLLFIPFLLGLMLGVFWSLKIRKYKGPGIKVMYETDIDSVKVEE